MFRKNPQKQEQKRLAKEQLHCNQALLRAASQGTPAEIRQLLDAGAEIETTGGFFDGSATPLNRATLACNLDLMQVLLERGANVNARDGSGDTPIRNAVIRGNTPAVKLLMRYGADPHIVSGNGKSAMTRAKVEDRQDLVDIMTGTKPDLLRSPAAPAPASGAAETPAAVPAGNTSGGPDEVVFRRTVGNRVIEEIFNFAEKERITLVRAGAEGPVEAVTREDFSALQEKPSLRRAFEEYARRGGAVPESEIFPDALPKVTPLKKTP
jgi:hypothetical protein